MERLSDRPLVSLTYAQLAVLVCQDGRTSGAAYALLHERLAGFRPYCLSWLDAESRREVVRHALDDTLVGAPTPDAAWEDAVFVGHVRTRARKLANVRAAKAEGLPLDFVEARSALRRVVQRLECTLGRLPSVQEVLADPAVMARQKPVPESHVAWLLEDHGARFVYVDEQERSFDEGLALLTSGHAEMPASRDACLELALRERHVRLAVELLLGEQGYTFSEMAQMFRDDQPPTLYDAQGHEVTWRDFAAEWPGLPASWEGVRRLYQKSGEAFVGVPAIRKGHRTAFDALARSSDDAGFFCPCFPSCTHHVHQERSAGGRRPASSLYDHALPMLPVLLFVGDSTVAALLRPYAPTFGYTLAWATPLSSVARARTLPTLAGIVLGRPDAALEAALRKALPETPIVTLPRLAPPTPVFDCPFRPDALMLRLETALQQART